LVYLRLAFDIVEPGVEKFGEIPISVLEKRFISLFLERLNGEDCHLISKDKPDPKYRRKLSTQQLGYNDDEAVYDSCP
jgi:hypothetical protein